MNEADNGLLEADKSLLQFKALSQALEERLRKREEQPRWDPGVFRKQHDLSGDSQGTVPEEGAGAATKGAPHQRGSTAELVTAALAETRVQLQHLQAIAMKAQVLDVQDTGNAQVRFSNATRTEGLAVALQTPNLQPKHLGLVALQNGVAVPIRSVSPVSGTRTLPPEHGRMRATSSAQAGIQQTSSSGMFASRTGGAVLGGQVQYRALLAAAQAASREGGARARAFQEEMTEIDAEIDEYVGNYKFEQYAPDAALAVQTAWRARAVRVFFNAYMAIRRKHLRRQVALVFGPLKQLVLAVLHARRRMLRRAFEEWRDWVQLGNELFLKLAYKLRASMGSIKEHATPQQLWQLCITPGGDPWAAQLSLGKLVANVLRRQMPCRTAAMYLAAWRRAVGVQVSKRKAAGEVLRRLDQSRFREYVRLLFRFWFRWSVIKVSERLKIPPPIFRPRVPEWDAWLFKHTRSRELHSRIILLHKGFRVRHFFAFWLFFMRRNKRMRQAWISTAAQHIEAILRNSLNAFKSNAAESRRLRRVKRGVFSFLWQMTQRNKTVRRIAKEVVEISRLSRLRMVMRRLREWGRANRMLFTSASIQIMGRRSTCLIPAYALVDDLGHMWFHWCWTAWRSHVLGRLRMRCLLGLHMSRANSMYLEVAFKALRKWAELQRMDRAKEALQQLLSPRGIVEEDGEEEAAEGEEAAAVARNAMAGGAAEEGAEEEVDLASRVSSVSLASPTNSFTAGAAAATAAGLRADGSTLSVASATSATVVPVLEVPAPPPRTFGLFVSLADYPLPPGASWRSPLDKQECLMRLAITDEHEGAAPLEPWNALGLSAAMRMARMGDAIDDLMELDGPFNLPPGQRNVLLRVARYRTLKGMHRQWTDIEHPVSMLFLAQGQPDARIWQRLVGLSVCDVPHPDNFAAQMVDQGRLPLAEKAARVRHIIRRARARPDAGTAPIAPLIAGAPSHPGVSTDSVSPDLTPRSMDTAVAAETSEPIDELHGRPRGILLTEDDENTMLLHRLCEAEDFLDTCMHVLLDVSGADTALLRRAIAARVIPGSLLGDALTEVLQPALAVDLSTVAAELRHRANRDRVITLGVDLADKARLYAEHRPEFTLTPAPVHGRRGAPSPTASALLLRLTGSPGASTANVTLERGVQPSSPTPRRPGSTAVVTGGSPVAEDTLTRAAHNFSVGSSSVKSLGDDDDMDVLRAQRRQAQTQQVEADVANNLAATASGQMQQAPAGSDGGVAAVQGSPLGSPSRRGGTRPSTLSVVKKSELIRMEMISGPVLASLPGSPVSPGAFSIPSPWRDSGAPAPESPASIRRSRSRGVSRAGGTPPRTGGGRTMSITFLGPDGAPAATTAAQAAATTATESPSGRAATGGRRMSRALSRRGSMKSMASGGTASQRTTDRAVLASPATGGGGAGVAPSEVSDLDPGTASEAAPEGPTAPVHVNNFLYMVPPGFLSAGKVLDPKRFPWPREVPSMDLINGKADFIMRAVLPHLAAMPRLPDIVFGPMGEPRASQNIISGEPSLLSHHSSVLGVLLPDGSAGRLPAEHSEMEAGGEGGEGASPGMEGSSNSLQNKLSSVSMRGFTSLSGLVAAGSGEAMLLHQGSFKEHPLAGNATGGDGSPVRRQVSIAGPADSRRSLFGPGSMAGYREPSLGGLPQRAPPRRQASMLGPGLSPFENAASTGGAGVGFFEARAMSPAEARKESRTQAMLEHMLGYDALYDGMPYNDPNAMHRLPGPLGADGPLSQSTSQSTSPRAARAAAFRRNNMAAQLLGLSFTDAQEKSTDGRGRISTAANKAAAVDGFKQAFSKLGSSTQAPQGDIGTDPDGTPINLTPRTAREEAKDCAEAGTGEAGEGGASASVDGTPSATRRTPRGGVRPNRRHMFRVTAQQLNIFMGGHLRRNTGPAGGLYPRGRHRPSEGGFTSAADGILVTPYGVQVVREEDEDDEEDAGPSAVAAGVEGSGGAAGAAAAPVPPMRRTKTVVIRDILQARPFEEQYNFRASVWLPPDQRTYMLDGYDLAALLASGTAGELPPQPLNRYMTPPSDSPFLRDFEEEVQRARTGFRYKPSDNGSQERWKVRSRLGIVSAMHPGGSGAQGSTRSALQSASPSRRRGLSAAPRFGRSRYPISEAAFLSDTEEGEEVVVSPLPSYRPAAAVAAAAAAAAVGEDPAVMRLLNVGLANPRQGQGQDAPGQGQSTRQGVIRTPLGGALSPWATSGAAAAATDLVGAGHSPLLSREGPSGHLGLQPGQQPGPHVLASLDGGASDGGAPVSPLSATGRTWQEQFDAEGSPPATSAGAAPSALAAYQQSPVFAHPLSNMFVIQGPPASPHRLRPGSRRRKRGNLRTGEQHLVDPLLVGTYRRKSTVGEAALSVAGADSSAACGDAASNANGALGAEAAAAGNEEGPGAVATGAARTSATSATGDAPSDVPSSYPPSELSLPTTPQGDITLRGYARPPLFEEKSQPAALLDEGVQQELQALRCMWSSDPYSQRAGFDPATGTVASFQQALPQPPATPIAASSNFAPAPTHTLANAHPKSGDTTEGATAASVSIGAEAGGAAPQSTMPAASTTGGAAVPVRIGAGLARALVEAEAEQWAVYDRAVERMAKEFAIAMQQLHGDAAPDGDGASGDDNLDDTTECAGSRPSSSLGAGTGPGSASAAVAAGMRGSSRRSAARTASRSAGGGARALSGSGRRTPLTGHANRGLLDALEEALAVSLDPTVLTGLSLEQYDGNLSELVHRLVVAPAASKHMFWKKVETVRQLRQRMLEDRSLAEQLQGIAWKGSFNPFTLAPPGTDAALGRAGPFAGEQLIAEDLKRQQQDLRKRRAERALQHVQDQHRRAQEERADAAEAAAQVQGQQLGGEMSLSLGDLLHPPAPGVGGDEPQPQAPTARSGASGQHYLPYEQHERPAAQPAERRAPWAPLDGHSPRDARLGSDQSVCQIVRPAALVPKPLVAATASSREVRLPRQQRHYAPGGVRPDAARSAAVSRLNSFRANLLAAIPNANDKLNEAHLGLVARADSLSSSHSKEKGNGKRRGRRAARQAADQAREEQSDGKGEGGDRAEDSDPYGDGTEVEEEKGTAQGMDPKGNQSQAEGSLQATDPGSGAASGLLPHQIQAALQGVVSSSQTHSGLRTGGAVPHYLMDTLATAQRAAAKAAERGATTGGPPSGYNSGWFLTEADAGSATPGSSPSRATSARSPITSLAPVAADGSGPDAAAAATAGPYVDIEDEEADSEARLELSSHDPGQYGGGAPITAAPRPRLTAGKLQVALARRAALRSALAARGELLELDEMDLEELEEEADLVDRLVEASIRVYGNALAARAARRNGAVAPGGNGAIAVPGVGVVMPGRGRALGWAPPGPHELERGDAMLLSPSDPWVRPVGTMATAGPHRDISPSQLPLRLGPAAAGTGAAAASRLTQQHLEGAKRGAAGALVDLTTPHLPQPRAQNRPIGLPASPPLAPAEPPKAPADPGTVRFPAPASGVDLLRSSAPPSLIRMLGGTDQSRMIAPQGPPHSPYMLLSPMQQQPPQLRPAAQLADSDNGSGVAMPAGLGPAGLQPMPLSARRPSGPGTDPVPRLPAALQGTLPQSARGEPLPPVDLSLHMQHLPRNGEAPGAGPTGPPARPVLEPLLHPPRPSSTSPPRQAPYPLQHQGQSLPAGRPGSSGDVQDGRASPLPTSTAAGRLALLSLGSGGSAAAGGASWSRAHGLGVTVGRSGLAEIGAAAPAASAGAAAPPLTGIAGSGFGELVQGPGPRGGSGRGGRAASAGLGGSTS